MPRRVVLVGHCGPDNSFLKMAITRADRDATIVAADDSAELEKIIAAGADLLLFNRTLDWGFDGQEGVAVIRTLRRKYTQLKMMLVSNYPEAQADAQAAGALPGFGKREIGSVRVTELIRDALAEIPLQKAE